ncbi:MAG TPA: hypothetical protein PKX15_02955 [Bacteroidales bacterium]|nr:hypothetical protein [Bacteroidales bacterium]
MGGKKDTSNNSDTKQAMAFLSFVSFIIGEIPHFSERKTRLDTCDLQHFRQD